MQPHVDGSHAAEARGDLPATLPAVNSSDEASTVVSHRRRRLHANFEE